MVLIKTKLLSLLLKTVDRGSHTYLAGRTATPVAECESASFNLAVWQSNAFLISLSNQVRSFELNSRKIRYSVTL